MFVLSKYTLYLIVDKLNAILSPLDNFIRNPKKDCNCASPSLLIIYLKLAKASKVKFRDWDGTSP
jgi:hypothetical protein